MNLFGIPEYGIIEGFKENYCLVSNFISGNKNALEGCKHSTILRNLYNLKITKASKKFAEKFYYKELDLEPTEWAIEACIIRNEIKQKIQDETPILGVLDIWFRNYQKYGNSLGPNCDATLFKDHRSPEKIKSPAQVINSSFKTDGTDLGIYGNEAGEIIPENYYYPYTIPGTDEV